MLIKTCIFVSVQQQQQQYYYNKNTVQYTDPMNGHFFRQRLTSQMSYSQQPNFHQVFYNPIDNPSENQPNDTPVAVLQPYMPSQQQLAAIPYHQQNAQPAQSRQLYENDVTNGSQVLLD